MDEKLTKTISIVIGLILAVVLLWFGFQIVQERFGKAAHGEPTNIEVTDITSTSFTVNFELESPASGTVKYGTSPTSLVFNAPFTDCSVCSVPLTLLPAETTQYYEITIGTDSFGCGGDVPCQATTIGAAAPPAETETVETPPVETEEPVVEETAVDCEEDDCGCIKENLGTYTAQEWAVCVANQTSE